MKKIIFLFSITYCFMLQSGSGDKETKNWYRKVLSNRLLALPASAIIGGSLAAGLKYFSHNNKLLSSSRVAEKINHVPYFKFVGAGMIAGVGFYELLKKFTKPKKTESEANKSGFNKEIKVTYICPGNLYSLLASEDGLESDTAKQIEEIISFGSIQKYSKNTFWFIETDIKYADKIERGVVALKNASYAEALYLIDGDQREAFKDKFAEKCSVYDLYKIAKPNTRGNLWCYALPLGYSSDESYNLQINPHITKDNIDKYSFKLTEKDAAKIDLNSKEIVGTDFKIRVNQKNTGKYSEK